MNKPRDEQAARIAEAGKVLTTDHIICESCERELPAGSVYCPHCCGDDGRDGATRRGGFVGGILGLMGGGVAAALWSSVVGPETATWEMVLGITFGTALGGAVLGMIRNRRE